MSLRPVDLYWVKVRDQNGVSSEHLTPTDTDAICEHMDQHGEPDMGDEFEWQIECEFWGTVEVYYETAEERKVAQKAQKALKVRQLRLEVMDAD